MSCHLAKTGSAPLNILDVITVEYVREGHGNCYSGLSFKNAISDAGPAMRERGICVKFVSACVSHGSYSEAVAQ